MRIGLERHELVAVELEERAGAPHEHAIRARRRCRTTTCARAIGAAAETLRACAACEADGGAGEREAPHRAVGGDVEIVERLVERVRVAHFAFDDVEDEARRSLARSSRCARGGRSRRPTRRSRRETCASRDGSVVNVHDAAQDERRPRARALRRSRTLSGWDGSRGESPKKFSSRK